MSEPALARAAEIAWLSASVLFAASSLRVLAVSAAELLAERSETPSTAGGAWRSVRPGSTTSAALPGASASSNASSVPSARSGPAIRVSLVVVGGAERSEVFVNGVSVGNSPFLGDVSCKVGELVRVELVPPAAKPRVYKYTCAPGTLRVEPQGDAQK